MGFKLQVGISYIRPIGGNEVTEYVLGDLPSERACEIEAMSREDEDLASTILVMRTLIGGACEGEAPNPDEFVAALEEADLPMNVIEAIAHWAANKVSATKSTDHA